MTISSCPSSGIAKRADSYDATVAACRGARPDAGLNRLMVDKALALGTAELLTAPERCLMMALLAHLDIAATAGGATAVWPGAGRLCALLGIGQSTLRRLKSSLEEKGFILRRYDRRNRPLRDGAIDLKPFLLKVPEILAALGHTEDLVADRRRALAAERADAGADMGASPPETERPIEETFPEEISERAGSDEEDRGHSSLAEAERIMPGVADGPADTAARLFGPSRGARLWRWARQRRGEDAILALAVAAKSPHVRDRSAWFAWYATHAGAFDLAGCAAAIPSAPGGGGTARVEAPFRPLADSFAREAGPEAAYSYLSDASFEAGEGGRLCVTVARRTAHARLCGALRPALERAARTHGFASCTVRLAPPGQEASL